MSKVVVAVSDFQSLVNGQKFLVLEKVRAGKESDYTCDGRVYKKVSASMVSYGGIDFPVPARFSEKNTSIITIN